MKKLTILAVAALAISFASCKKDHTCTCTTVTTFTGGSTTGTSTWTILKAKKGDARAACLSTKSTDATSNSTTERTCTLS